MIPSLAAIDRSVARSTRFDPRRRTRYREYVQARWLAFWVAEQFGYSLTTIGRHFELDHTTVLHGLRKIHPLLDAGVFAAESREVLAELVVMRTGGGRGRK